MYSVYVSSPHGRIQERHNRRPQYCRHQPADMFGSFLQRPRDPWRPAPAYTPWYVLWDNLPVKDKAAKLPDKAPARTDDHTWVYKLCVDGFQPADIKVTVESRTVTVTGRREDRGPGFIDRREIQRKVVVPDNVDVERLSCIMADDGKIVLKAPVYDRAIENQTMCGEQRKSCRTMNGEKQIQMTADADTAKKQTGERDGDEMNGDKSQVRNTSGVTTNTGDTHTSDATDTTRHMTTDEHRPPSQSDDSFEMVEQPQTTGGRADTESQGMEEYRSETVESDVSSSESHVCDLPPNDEESRIVKEDGHDVYKVNVNLGDFKPEDVSVKCRGNILSIDASEERREDGVYRLQQVHRQFTIPKTGQFEAATAAINESGHVRISIPLDEKAEKEIPIHQDDRHE